MGSQGRSRMMEGGGHLRWWGMLNPITSFQRVFASHQSTFMLVMGALVSVLFMPTHVLAQTSAPTVAPVVANITEGSCGGVLLSYWGTEGETDFPLFIAYALIMFYIFGGVAVAADAFMGSIEAITAETKEVTLGAGMHERVVQVEVWNKTVSNLSLMALGSSAPEILLAVIEVCGNDFESGDLGPGTIVGSAAFNMLIIIAICMTIEPVKRVEAILVLYITASASVAAYVWLYCMVDIISPNVIDIWEAAVTIAMFPVMLLIAFAADRGWLDGDLCAHKVKNARRSLAGLDMLATTDHRCMQHLVSVEQVPVHAQGTSEWNKELRREIRKIKKQNPKYAIEEVYVRAFETVKSHPHAPVLTTAAARKSVDFLDITSSSNLMTEDLVTSEVTQVGFAMGYYDCAENVGKIQVPVTRSGDMSRSFTLMVKTIDSTAVVGRDFQLGAKSDKIVFKPGQKTSDVEVNIVNHGESAPNAHFMLELALPSEAKNTADKLVQETVLDGDFGKGGSEIHSTLLTTKITKIRIVDAYEFKSCWDRLSKTISSTIVALFSKEPSDSPYIEQIRCAIRGDEGNEEDDSEDATDSGDTGDDANSGDGGIVVRSKVYDLGEESPVSDKKAGDEKSDQEEDGTSFWGWFVYLYLVVFKVLLAIFSIPVQYGHGWWAFASSLVWIAIWTALCGDLATGMGCTVGLADSITAITFVALGTSVPDTFASKIAAEEDDNADPAIGNVTGSNAVNVFLGVGLSWLIGSVVQRVKYDSDFVVQSGTLAFSVLLFVILSLIWFTTLTFRRYIVGGELGGPAKAKWLTVGLFVFMWIFFITMSSLVEYDIVPNV